MCLIVLKPKGLKIPDEYVYNAYDNNSDGFGAMWCQNGRVRVVQGIYKFGRIMDMVREWDEMQVAMHFRFCTVGTVSIQNVHPFQVLSKEIHGEDLWMMHNGTFSFLKPKDSHSDTWLFSKKLEPVVGKIGIDELYRPNRVTKMGEKIGKHNKILFMRGNGSVTIVNSESGFYEDGAWYSNAYSLTPALKYEWDDDLYSDGYNGRQDMYNQIWGTRNRNPWKY